jgi:hypothetical protein
MRCGAGDDAVEVLRIELSFTESLLPTCGIAGKAGILRRLAKVSSADLSYIPSVLR